MDIKSFIKEKKWRSWRKEQWLILFLAGVLLLVIALPSGQKNKDSITNSQKTLSYGITTEVVGYEGELEQRLETMLMSMEGVGAVDVMITLEREEQGEEALRPSVEGVFVVAEGGENMDTVQNISQAIQALFDIDAHKIKIVKMNL